MVSNNSTAKTEMIECPLCHEIKAKSRFFTQDADSVCRRCHIGLLYEKMQAGLKNEAVKYSWRSILSHGYVYVFYSDLMGLYKIGKSINPNDRRYGFSIPNIKLIFAFYTQHMSVHETLIHRIYQPQRVGGEWFRLENAHVDEIKVIGSKLGIVIDSPEDFDWHKMVTKQKEIEGAHWVELRKIKESEETTRLEAYRAYKAQFRRRCPNCLRLFPPKDDHKFCTRGCLKQYKNSKRIQNAYLSDPDNMVIAIEEARAQLRQYDYDESEIGVQHYRAATKRLQELEQAQAILDELANQAYHLMID